MNIPIQMRPIYGELAEMISDYCSRFLSEDYRTLCLRLLEKLCRKRPSPLLKGRRNTWAAGIVYAIAANNLIFDKSMPIHRTADELSRPFGLAPATASARAAEIRRLVRLSPLDAQWLLPELIEDSPALWMLSWNGFIVDARDLPPEIQREAARMGLIPYAPAMKEAADGEKPPIRKKNLPRRIRPASMPPPQTPLTRPKTPNPLPLPIFPMISRISMIVFGQSDHQKPLKTRRFRGFFFLPDHTFYPFDPRGATFLQLLFLKYCIIFFVCTSCVTLMNFLVLDWLT